MVVRDKNGIVNKIVIICSIQVNLFGEKVVDPLIHSCEKCSLPILIYGRMVCGQFSFFAHHRLDLQKC